MVSEYKIIKPKFSMLTNKYYKNENLSSIYKKLNI